MKTKVDDLMLDIKVNEEYKLESDGMQIIIYRKQIVDPTKSPAFNPEKHSSEIREVFKPFKYTSNIQNALDIILKQNILESNAKYLVELRNEISEFKKHIEKLILG